MFSGPKKPYSAVSVQIERLTSEQYEEDDMSGIIDLIEVIRIQDSGPTEAARSIRKKLKYGNPHRQVRALTILDGLIQNAGSRFQKTFADEPLLERLRVMARDDMVDQDVRRKCNVLFRQWAAEYKNTPGLTQIAHLSQQLPTTKRAPPAQYKVLRETEAEAQEHQDEHPQSSHGHSRASSSTSAAPTPPSPSRPVNLSTATHHFGSSSKLLRGKKDKNTKVFSLEREKPNIMQTIASSSVASTNLLNALQLINREKERVSDNPEVLKRFETCKALRRQVLRYIQLVESDEWIGSLLSANDELVKGLMAYEILDKSLDDDSDSDAWETPEGAAASKIAAAKSTEEQLAGLNLGEAPPAKPPRPGNIGMPAPPRFAAPSRAPDTPGYDSSEEEDEEVDDDDPFGDANAVKTPHIERPGMTWKQV